MTRYRAASVKSELEEEIFNDISSRYPKLRSAPEGANTADPGHRATASGAGALQRNSSRPCSARRLAPPCIFFADGGFRPAGASTAGLILWKSHESSAPVGERSIRILPTSIKIFHRVSAALLNPPLRRAFPCCYFVNCGQLCVRIKQKYSAPKASRQVMPALSCCESISSLAK